ncbi:MAG: hypothetical protein IJ837_04595 [Clostridia bacterium]|nr:hypothetical protein [Clostridia bacterium]
MPSLTIHLAVGMEYLKNFEILNKEMFLDGVMAPDLLGRQGKVQKRQAHFSDKCSDFATFQKACESYVNLYSYLSKKDIKNDYDRGYFLHLLTDYLFYTKFVFEQVFKKDKTIDENSYCPKFFYDDYNCVDKHIEAKYNVNNSKNPWAGKGEEGEPKYLKKTDLYKFIDLCSKIDLEKLREKVLTNKDDWQKEVKNFINKNF